MYSNDASVKDGVDHKFIHAVRQGDLEELKALINWYGMSNSPDWSLGYVLLRFAIESKHTNIAKLLLENGSRVNDSSGGRSTTPLHFAVKNNDLEMVKILVKEGAVINAEDTNGITPFYIAVEEKYSQIAEYLLNCGAWVNFFPPTSNLYNGFTPLHIATKNGSEELVKLLLSKNAYVDAKANDSTTPLHIAVQCGHLQVADRLLKHGASVDSASNQFEKKGYTPLHFAAQTGKKKIIDLLLSSKSNVDAKSEDNLTPLHVAVKNNNGTAVKILLEHGADVNARTNDNQTPLNLAVENGCPILVENILNYGPDTDYKFNRSALYTAVSKCGKEFEKIIDHLVNGGFVIQSEDVNNGSLLYYAAHNGHGNILEDLLKYGADANYKESITWRESSLLHIAAKNGHGSIVRLLINYGADVNTKDRSFRSPIYYAVYSANLETIEMLLNSAANLDDSYELFNLAVENKRRDIVEILLKYNADINAVDKNGTTVLHSTVSVNDNEEILKLILNKGIDVNARLKDGETALHVAIKNGQQGMVNLLLEFNADVNSLLDNDTTPLHLAASNGSESITTMLSNKGADINSVKSNGLTALHIASENGHTEVVKILLMRGAEFDPDVNRYATLLHTVTEKGHQGVVEILLKNGADIDSMDEKGETALHIASKHGYERLVKLFLDYGCDVNIVSKKKRSALDFATARETLLSHNHSGYDCYSSDDENFDDHRACFRQPIPCSYAKIIKILLRHMVRMKSAGFYVNLKNIDSEVIMSSKIVAFRSQCDREITRMNSEFVSNNVSFYDVLTNGIRKLEIYTRNESIRDVLKSDDYKTKFPIYAKMIDLQFRKGMERNDLLERSHELFNVLSTSFSILLPHDCIRHILRYLNNRDLKNLINVCPTKF